MRTAVVILNWNTAEYLKAFLPGVYESCEGVADLYVADNASTDGSVAVLTGEFPGVKNVLLDRNYGFTGGYNRVLAQLEGYEYFVLLNSDIEVDKGWLEPLIGWMDSHPRCGVCGPKLHGLVAKEDGGYERTNTFEYAGAAGGLLDRYGFPYCRGRVLSRVAQDSGQYDSPADVLWVTGACLVTRASLWKELGGLDDRFFAHCEEIDYCWRAQLSGWSVSVVPQSTVWHLGGGTLPQNSPFKLQLNFRNNLLMLANNLAPTYETMGLSPEKAAKKAERLLKCRMFLDNLAKIVYICTGRIKYAKAVRKAHEEFRELRHEAPERKYSGLGSVKGWTRKSILLTGNKTEKI